MGINFMVYDFLVLYGSTFRMNTGTNTDTGAMNPINEEKSNSMRSNSDGVHHKSLLSSIYHNTLAAAQYVSYGAIAGTISKLLTYPLDTLKKHTQLQSVECSYVHNPNTSNANAKGNLVSGSASTASNSKIIPKFNSLASCAAWTWKNEGMRGYYKVITYNCTVLSIQ